MFGVKTWLIGGAVVVALAVLSFAGLKLYNAGKAACEARVAIEVAQEVKRQTEAAFESLQEARDKAEKRALENAELRNTVEEYEENLRDRGVNNSCVLDDGDAERLRNIR